MAFSQITPNPLPYDRTLNLVGNATYKNTENFDMWGSIIINSGITLDNSAPFNINSGRLTNSGQIINSDTIHFANFESKLQHFCVETNLANMVHGEFAGAQTK